MIKSEVAWYVQAWRLQKICCMGISILMIGIDTIVTESCSACSCSPEYMSDQNRSLIVSRQHRSDKKSTCPSQFLCRLSIWYCCTRWFAVPWHTAPNGEKWRNFHSHLYIHNWASNSLLKIIWQEDNKPDQLFPSNLYCLLIGSTKYRQQEMLQS